VTGVASRPPALDPVVLARISSLALRARLVVEGTLSGLHPSPHHGSSVEFADHRDYTPGDEIRHIDWKLAGKSDKLYVKRFEHETNLRACFLLDVSGSMAYGERGMSKLDYARTLVASLAWLLLEQRDAVGLGLFRQRLERWLPPRAHRAHLPVLLGELEAARAEGPGSAAGAVEELAERIPRRGLVVLVTDALEEVERLGLALGRLRHRRHDVTLLEVLDPDELELPFDQVTRFRSLEDSRSLLADPPVVRRAYLEALGRHRRALARHCRAHEIDYASFVTTDPLDRALVRFLGARR
jgi:uncharacterized protein (DUF58 family)